MTQAAARWTLPQPADRRLTQPLLGQILRGIERLAGSSVDAVTGAGIGPYRESQFAFLYTGHIPPTHGHCKLGSH